MTLLTEAILAEKFRECAADPQLLMHETAKLIEQGMQEIVDRYNAIHPVSYRLIVQAEKNGQCIIAVKNHKRPVTRGGILKLSTGKFRSHAVAIRVENYAKSGGLLSWQYPDVGMTLWPNRAFSNACWEENTKKPALSHLRCFSMGRPGAPVLPLPATEARRALELFTALLPWDSVKVDYHLKGLKTPVAA